MSVQQGHPAGASTHQEIGRGGAEAAQSNHDDIRIANHPILMGGS
jgi:hypothetical protein